MIYKIYAGLKHMNGAVYQCTVDVPDRDTALNYARDIAETCYFENMGSYKTSSWEELDNKALDEITRNGRTASEEDIIELSSHYAEREMEYSIDFNIVETDSLDDEN